MNPMFRSTVSVLALGMALSAAHAQTPAREDAPTPDVTVQAAPGQAGKVSADTSGTKSYTSGAVTVAGKEALTRREVPSSVSVMTRQQMDDLGAKTFHEALNWVPGISIVSNDPGQSQYISRGYGLESATNGAGTYSAVSGWQQFDTVIYDRLEVFKGPAGLLQGNGGPGGTINMVKKKPLQDWAASATVSGGSWRNFREEFDIGGPLNASKTVRFRAAFANQNKHFFYDRAKEDRWTGYGAIEVDLTPNTLLSASYAYQKYDGPTYTGQPAFATGAFTGLRRSLNVYPDWGFYRWNSGEASIALEHRFNEDWVAKASYTRRDQQFEFKDAFPNNGVAADYTTTYRRRHWVYDYTRDVYDAYISGGIDVFGLKQKLLLGYTYNRYLSYGQGINVTPNLSNISIFNPNSIPDFNLPFNSGSGSENRQSGFYGQLRLKPIEPVTVVLGGRLTDFDSRSRTRAPSPTPTEWSPGAFADRKFSGYAGLIYDVTKNISVYGSYADIFSPNTAKDYTGKVLEPRVGGQQEVGIKGSWFDNRLNASVAAFRMDEVNRPLSDPNNPGFSIASGKIKTRGWEAEVSGQLLPNLQVMGGYTLLTSQQAIAASASLGQPISWWYPKHQYKLWATYTVDQGPLTGLKIGGGVLHQTATRAGSGTSLVRVQPAYTVVNAMASYDISKHVTAKFSIENIFDTKYMTRLGGTNTYNTWGAPRNYMFSLTGKL